VRRGDDRPGAANKSLDFLANAAARADGALRPATEQQRRRLLMDYYKQINAAQLPDGVGKMKQFACWFTHGVGNGSELRRIVHAAHTPAEVLESVEGFFVDRFTVAKNEAGAPWSPVLTGAQEEADPVGVARNEDPAHGPSSEHASCEATHRT